MLNGTAQDDLLQNAKDRGGKGNRQVKQKWTATKKWKGGNRRRSEFSEGEYSFYMIVTATMVADAATARRCSAVIPAKRADSFQKTNSSFRSP
jgi:hypothetical protein